MDELTTVAKPLKEQSNIEFLCDVMNYSQHGAMMQMFVMEALRRYADQCVEGEQEILEGMEGTMFSGPAWVGCAKEIQEKMREKYGD